MTDGPPPCHLHPVEPPFDPDYDGRRAPQDLLAERAVLATLLEPPAHDGTHPGDQLATELDTDDFYLPEHQTIWNTWHQLHTTDGVPPDAVTLNAAIVRTRDVPAIRALTNLVANRITEPPNPALADSYAKLVRDQAKLRVVDEVATGLRLIVNHTKPDQIDHYLGEALQRLDDTVMRFGPRTTTNSTWAPLDLDQVLAGGEIDPPPALLERADGQMLLYAGAIHTVSGEPGSGKTWLTLLAAVQQLADGHTVTMIDFEDRASRVIGRLLALGAHPDVVRHHFRYVRPNTGLDTTTQTDLLNAVTNSSIVILDGVTEAMTMHGYDLNSNADVASFYDLLPRRIADHTGAAVVMIDHVVKDGEKQGRWALGGQHKLAGIDGVAYLVKAIDKFGRGKIGHARLIVSKDRPGYVEEIALGMTVAELVLDARDVNCLRADLKAPTETPIDEAGNMRPTVLMERVSRWLELSPGANRNRITDGVTGKTTYVRRALDRLIQEGYVEVTAGPNRQQLHRVLTPFHQDPEEDQA